jgi:hypothetical protein
MKSAFKNSSAVTELPDVHKLKYRFIETSAPGTHVGKTFLALYICALYSLWGYRPILVTVESKKVDRKGDVVIHTEDFAHSGTLLGGPAGVLRKFWEVLAESANDPKAVIVMDWGGGLANYRNEIYASTGFGAQLQKMGIQGLSLILTTNESDRMKHATENLRISAQVAAELDRCLVLNEMSGPFAFAASSAQNREFIELQNAATGASTLKLRAVTGESWKYCSNANLTMRQVIDMSVEELAARLNENLFIATACQAQVAAWWLSAEKAIQPILMSADGAAG